MQPIGSFSVTLPPLSLDSLQKQLNGAFLGADCVDDFKSEYLSHELLSKYCDGSTDREFLVRAAMERLELSEQMCAVMNKQPIQRKVEKVWISEHILRPQPIDYTSKWMSAVLFHAAERASEILGVCSYEWTKYCRLTNGASLGHRKKDAYPVAKLKGDFFVTPKAKPYLAAFADAVNPRIFQGVKMRLALGNRVETVPKNNKTDRVIAIEPEGNVLLQKGMGTWLKGRLKNFGIDLYDQQRNRQLAQSLLHATIDLSMASDTISQRIVLEILPLEWYDLLDSLRSHYGRMPDGTWRKWEKFSSMGNGFTFELETLLFHCLAFGVSNVELGSYRRRDFCTYGDDIIAPVGVASSLVHALTVCGFKTNPEKTFISGPFRESCGAHYFEGQVVTPFYIRSPVDTLMRYIWLGNSVRKWAAITSDYADCRAFDVWNSIKESIPRSLRGGRDLNSQCALVSDDYPRSLLRPMSGKPWEGTGYRAVAAWLLQSPVGGRSADLSVVYSASQEESTMNEFIASLEWVYSGITPYQIKHLYASRSSVGPPVTELSYEITGVFDNLCDQQRMTIVGLSYPRFAAET